MIEQIVVGIVFTVRGGLTPVISVSGASAVTIALAGAITLAAFSLVVLHTHREQAMMTVLSWIVAVAPIIAVIWLATGEPLRSIATIAVPMVVLALTRRMPSSSVKWASSLVSVLWLAWLSTAMSHDLFIITCSAIVCLVVTIMPVPSRCSAGSPDREVVHGAV